MSDPASFRAGQEPANFDALLKPHRSLSPRGFLLLMLAVGGVNLGTGIAFLLMGAWPVFGFCGLDVLVIYIAFKLNYRAAGLHETVQLTPAELLLRRVQPSGAEESWRFNPYWVRLVVDTDTKTERATLTLRSHGQELTFGQFLPEEEKIEFAQALGAALAKARGSS